MKKLTNIIWVIVLACIFFIPLIASDVHQGIFYALCCLLLITLFIHTILTRTYLKDHIITFWLIAWLLVVFFTSLFCRYRYLALNDAFYFFLYVAVFFMISGLDSEKRKQIFIVIAIASVFVSIKAVLQHLFYFDMVIPYLESQKVMIHPREFYHIKNVIERGRVVASFVTPNLLASYLAMVNLIVLGLIATVRYKVTFWGLCFLFLLNLVSLLLTTSIAGLGSFVLGVFLFIIISLFIMPKDKTRFKAIGISFGAIIVIMFIGLFTKRFVEIGTDNLVFSLRGRLQFWKSALYIIKMRPFSFSGLGSFGYLFRQLAVSSKIESTMAHNLILQLWIETGIYGLLAFAGFMAAVTYNVKEVILSKTTQLDIKFQSVALLAAVFAFLLYNMAGFSFFVPQVALLWWIVCALLMPAQKED